MDAVLDPGGLHDPVDHAGVEAQHEVVLQRQVEPRLPRVTLTTRTTTQLVVDAPRLVPFGAQDVEPTEVLDLVVLLGHGSLGGSQGVVPGLFVLLRGLLGVQPAPFELLDRAEL